MKDIDQLIENIHHSNAEHRLREHTPSSKPQHHTSRYAAAAVIVLAIVAAIGILLLHPGQSATKPRLLASHQSEQKQYAYSESTTGIRVYCENGCNADEVVQAMREALLSLD